MSLCSPLCLRSISRSVRTFHFFSLSSFNRSVYYCYHVLKNCLENESKDFSIRIDFYYLTSIWSSFEFSMAWAERQSTTSLGCVKFVTFVNSHSWTKRKFRRHGWWFPHASWYRMYLETPHKNSLPQHKYSSSDKMDYLCKYVFYHLIFIARCIWNTSRFIADHKLMGEDGVNWTWIFVQLWSDAKRFYSSQNI